jgi:hypothetical protein
VLAVHGVLPSFSVKRAAASLGLGSEQQVFVEIGRQSGSWTVTNAAHTSATKRRALLPQSNTEAS